MSRTGRRVAVVAAAFAALVLLALLALPYVVSLDAVRARVVAAAESSLHRKVEIGAMRLQVLSGLGAGVERLVVHDRRDPSGPPLLTADRASIKVAFWPLLSRRVEVRRLELRGVTVTVERGPDGKLSVSDFVSAGQRESAPASQTAAAALLVSRIDLESGRAVFVDHRAGRADTLSIDDLTAHLRDIGARAPARFDVAARFLADKGRNVTLQGTLGPPPSAGPVGEAPLDARFSAKGVALGRLAPWVAAFREDDPGTLSMDATAQGKLLGALAIAGKLALDPVVAPGTRMPAADGTIALTLDWMKGTLAIDRSLFDVAELPIQIEGRIDRFHETPEIDLRVGTPGDVPLDHVTGLPGIAGRFPEGVKLAGNVRFDARIQGPAPDLAVSGTADAALFRVTRDAQPLLDAPGVHATVESKGAAPLSGRVSAAGGRLRELPFENLRADWTWDKGVLTLASSAGVSGGTLDAHLRSDFGKPGAESRVAFELHGIQAQPLVESTTTVRNVLSGTLNGNFSLVSRGLGWDAISKTGRGDGHLAVTDAEMRTVQLMPAVSRALGAVGRVAGFDVPESLERTHFTKLETSLKLADGRLATPDVTMSGPDVSGSAQGSVGLDRTISYEGRVVLGASVLKSLGKAGRYLADASGTLAVPFRATGPVSSPSVSVDESLVLELGRRILTREAADRVGGAAGKALGDALGGGKASGAIDVLQQLLRAPAPTPTPPH
ncbi:MAG TPA: AsmA-like C-terminal region-containing protein [Thermoanaerobaculia bacterium]|nr:AsmA-like C-terminal region-containing protein [Thermoanaerobaculia bacterium]